MQIKIPSKRSLRVISCFLVAVLIVAALLVAFANTVLKHELEKALGDKLRVAAISLGWNSIEATDITYAEGAQPLFKAKKVRIRASFFALLGKGYSISSLEVEEPAVTIEIDEKGALTALPSKGPSGAKGDVPGAMPAVALKHVVIKEGTLFFRDRRLPAPDSVEVTHLNLRLDNLSFPFESGSSKLQVQAQLSGKLVSGVFSCSGSVNGLTREGEVKIQASAMRLLTGADGNPQARAEAVSLTLSSKGHPEGIIHLVASDVQVTKPFLRIEEDRAGHFISPAVPSTKKEAPEKKGPSQIAILFNKVTITGGEALYVDNKISQPPATLRLTDIDASIDQIAMPFDSRWSTYQVSARIPSRAGEGQFRSSGKANLKTLDTEGKATIRNFDVTIMRPYVEKKGDAQVVRGSLDMDMNLNIKDKTINAPVHAVIKNLEFAQAKGLKDQFLGMPRSLLVKSMETGNRELPIDFVVAGKVDNPKFSLSESFYKRFTVTIAQKLGLSVVETGENVVIQGGRALQGIGKGLKSLFK